MTIGKLYRFTSWKTGIRLVAPERCYTTGTDYITPKDIFVFLGYVSDIEFKALLLDGTVTHIHGVEEAGFSKHFERVFLVDAISICRYDLVQ